MISNQQIFIISHYGGSGIREWLSWVVLAQGLSWGPVKLQSSQGWLPSSPTWLFLEGCWPETWVPHCLDFSKGLHRTWHQPSPRVSDPKERESDKEGSCSVFYNPNSSVMPTLPGTVREGMTGGGVIGATLEAGCHRTSEITQSDRLSYSQGSCSRERWGELAKIKPRLVRGLSIF